MIELQPNEWMMLAAMLGALVHMCLGYVAAKKKNPEEGFESTYLTKTILTILAMGMMFENIEVANLTMGGILFAILSGMGGNKVLSKAPPKPKPKTKAISKQVDEPN